MDLLAERCVQHLLACVAVDEARGAILEIECDAVAHVILWGRRQT